MRQPIPEAEWPESWRLSHTYDLMEVFGSQADLNYSRRYRERHRRAVDAVAAVTPSGGRVLDVAGAQGNFTLALAERGYAVTWNDLREDLVDYVRAKHETGSVTYRPGNVFDLEADGYDTVLATEVIEHVAHPDQFLMNLARLVRPGGHIVVTTPNGEFLRNDLPRFSDFPDPSVFESEQFKPDADGHIFLLYDDEVRDLVVRAGLSLVELTFFANVLTCGFMRTASLAPRAPALVSRLERLTSRWTGRAGRSLNTQMLAVMSKGV